MKFGKVCGILFVLSLAASGAAMGRGISHGHGTAGAKATAASPAKVAAAKANKSTAKSNTVPVAVRHVVKPPAPIVMGRSVSVHRNTKLHHVKIEPLDSVDTPVAAAGTSGSY
jgi:hypothetical protein